MTARSVPEWIGKTPDTAIPTRVRIRVFDRHNGVCHISGRKIKPGESWHLEHVISLANGGENRESNLAPALVEFHKLKTKDDVKEKSIINRKRAKHIGAKTPPRVKMRSAGFPNVAKPERNKSTLPNRALYRSE